MRFVTAAINSLLDANTSHPGFVRRLADIVSLSQTFSQVSQTHDESPVYVCMHVCIHLLEDGP